MNRTWTSRPSETRAAHALTGAGRVALILMLSVPIAWHAVSATGAPAQAGDDTMPSGVVWRAIPSGTFEMGCMPGDSDCRPNEQPRHRVTLTQAFELMETEVTVRQFREWAAARSLRAPRQPPWNGDEHPIVNVTWEEMRAFCQGIGGRLPTEAEWEFAARGGADGAIYPWGPAFDPDLANGIDRAGADTWARTAPVGSFPSNAYGLRDMIGNVWEWVADWYWPLYFGRSVESDPPGAAEGRFRALRGGSWDNEPEHLRTSFRFRLSPTGRYPLYVGGRCARDIGS